MPVQKSRIIVFVVIIVVLTVLVGGCGWFVSYRSRHNEVGSTNTVEKPAQTDEKRYILSGYPIETVPLYQMREVSASKFFVNHDPQNRDDYFGKQVNYYNVVYKTDATPEETLGYYRSLMTAQNTDSESDEQVQGLIGKYRVSVSHYNTNPENVYVKVYLPADEYQQANRYYSQYPNLGLVDETWANYESSYGLLNQRGGQIEYTQYFALPLDSDVLINAFKAKKQSMPEFAFNEETGTMQWQEESHTVTLTFSKDHQRIYLMIRKPL